jgi:hypothetical protein
LQKFCRISTLKSSNVPISSADLWSCPNAGSSSAPLPKARQGLGESQPKGARVLAPRLNPPHAQKTMQSGLKSPDGLLEVLGDDVIPGRSEEYIILQDERLIEKAQTYARRRDRGSKGKGGRGGGGSPGLHKRISLVKTFGFAIRAEGRGDRPGRSRNLPGLYPCPREGGLSSRTKNGV